MEDAATISQLLLDWETADGSVANSSAGEELLGLFGELHAPVFGTQPDDDENTDAGPSVSRSSLCRRRQREEIKRLRQEANELETQLARLRDGTAAKRQRGSPCGTSDVVEVPRFTSGVWERIASHQKELKCKVQRENDKLRDLISEHRKLTARIKKALHHRTLEEQTKQATRKKAEQTISALGNKAAEHWKSTAASPQWQRIFHVVFHNESFWMKELERELLSISADTNGHTVIEAVYSKVFPFDVTKTSQAMWHIYKSHSMALAGGYFSATSASENMLVAEVEVSLDLSGKALLLGTDVLIHKIHEDTDRVVFVWEDWSPSAEKHANNIQVTGNGRSLTKVRMSMDVCVSVEQLTRGSPDQGGEGTPATLMRVYSISRPSYDEPIQEDPIRVSRDKLVESYHDSNRRFSQLVETYLLDDALGLGTALTASA